MHQLIVMAVAALALPVGAQRAAVIPPSQPTSPPVINTRPTSPVLERYGLWAIERLGKGYAAYTNNDSSSVFGVLCNDGCIAYTGSSTRCEQGAKYPALVNSSAGAFSIVLTCEIVGQRHLMGLPLSKTLVDAFEIGGEIGIAVPLESGKFSVTRFSLTGALKAANRAVELGNPQTPESKDRGLRDYEA